MLRSKHLVGLILAATLMATLIPFSTMVYAQNQDEKFEKIAEQAKEKVDELGALIVSASDTDTLTTWPDDFPQEIQTIYSWAEGNYTAGDYKDAMKSYREVFEMLNIYAEEQGLFEGAETGSGVGEDESEHSALGEAINRTRERIARIEDANNTYVSMYGWDTTIGPWIQENVTAAKTNLDEAETALEIPNVGWAAANLTEANHNIRDAFAALRELASWTNSWRIESFLMGIKKSYERTLELLDKKGITPDSTIMGYIVGNITDAREHMINAMKYWDDGKKSDAKTEHKNAIEDLRNARDQLRLLRKGGEG